MEILLSLLLLLAAASTHAADDFVCGDEIQDRTVKMFSTIECNCGDAPAVTLKDNAFFDMDLKSLGCDPMQPINHPMVLSEGDNITVTTGSWKHCRKTSFEEQR